MSLDIEITSKEWSRIVYLIKKAMGKKPKASDEAILWKCHIFAEQTKKDEVVFSSDDD